MKRLIFSFLAYCLLTSAWAQNVTVSGYYKTDGDGDGVPDVRDKCPDTDKNLNGQEFKIEVRGKEMFVKIVDLKGNFENRRRRLLVDISRLDKEKRKIVDEAGGKTDRLDAGQQSRLAEIDTLVAQKKNLLINLCYEAEVIVDGQKEIVEIFIGVDPFGCLPDRDGDGIPDLVDKCPDHPGIRLYFGCNDRDGDTVLDHEDDCPDEPGLVRLKGCPDKGEGDRDGDGTKDKDDVCPDVPGPKDNKGCPKITSKVQDDIIQAASKVLFDSGKSTLRPESTQILDKLVDVILELAAKYKKLSIRLEGHTDTDGTNESNLLLSRNRAQAVKTYIEQALEGKNVEVSISAAGYGEERLKVSPEYGSAGKQANRRVEITIAN
ncbi:MAG: OmpA family protein [Microscillaceae bacterium]|nr:OmpA family protein [Microscillaceae bacterium]